MDARRLDLKLRWNQVAAIAKVHEATLRAIRAGTNRPSQLTGRRLEDALQWSHGSIDSILNGGEPTPIGGEDESRTPAQPDKIADAIEALRRVAEDPEASQAFMAAFARAMERGDRSSPDSARPDSVADRDNERRDTA
jgi:hypothetical protein